MDFCICFGVGFCVMNGIWASSARWRILDSDTLVHYCVRDLLPQYVLPSLRTLEHEFMWLSNAKCYPKKKGGGGQRAKVQGKNTLNMFYNCLNVLT